MLYIDFKDFFGRRTLDSHVFSTSLGQGQETAKAGATVGPQPRANVGVLTFRYPLEAHLSGLFAEHNAELESG